MSAHGPSARHVFVHEDGMPLADLWTVDWEEVDRLADRIRSTPIDAGLSLYGQAGTSPQPYRRNR